MSLTTQQINTIERLNAKQRYYLRNTEKCKEMTTSWKERNKEYIKEYNKAYMRLYRAKKQIEKTTKKLKPRSHLAQDDPDLKQYLKSQQ